MSRFTFICEDEPMPFMEGSSSKKTVEFECDNINGVLYEFELFLKGCGYNLNNSMVEITTTYKDDEIYVPPKSFADPDCGR